MPRDLILSSGFLAFARHIGVLMEVERPEIDAVVGTSSGALVGALWAAGHSPETICDWIAERRPMSLIGLHLRPWRGALSLRPLEAFLRERLPARFDELQHPLAVGVIDHKGDHLLLMSGDLPSAVTASCAMPMVFHPVEVDGHLYQDGGAADRLALGPWRQWRPGREAIAHRVQRTAGKDLADVLDDVTLVETPRSGASFLSLGDVRGQVAEAKRIAAQELADSALADSALAD